MHRIATTDNFHMFREAQFLICDSCFWCASILGNSMMVTCPLCQSTTLESVPIMLGESYKFDYSAKSGVMLEFVED